MPEAERGEPLDGAQQIAARQEKIDALCRTRRCIDGHGQPAHQGIGDACRIKRLHDPAELGLKVKRHEPNILDGPPTERAALSPIHPWQRGGIVGA